VIAYLVALHRKLLADDVQASVSHHLGQGCYKLSMTYRLKGLCSRWGGKVHQLFTGDDLCAAVSDQPCTF